MSECCGWVPITPGGRLYWGEKGEGGVSRFGGYLGFWDTGAQAYYKLVGV